MHRGPIILVVLVLPVWLVFFGCKPWAPQQLAPPAPPVVVQPVPTNGTGPSALAPSPLLIDQGPGLAPIYPPQSTAVPVPSQTPGSIFGPPLVSPAAPAGSLADIAPGGAVSPQFGLPPGPEALAAVPSSITVPVTNDEWAWDQITDVVSDYFTITGEQPARRGEVAMEGRIDTAPQDGATWLEPQRKDSVGRFNRWESTFQTIRRRATVRVIPVGPNYTVEVTVQKELEDLPHPERATAGAAMFRNDTSLNSERPDHAESVSRTHASPRWIDRGRDPPLEQRMLSEMHARLTGAATASSPLYAPF